MFFSILSTYAPTFFSLSLYHRYLGTCSSLSFCNSFLYTITSIVQLTQSTALYYSSTSSPCQSHTKTAISAASIHDLFFLDETRSWDWAVPGISNFGCAVPRGWYWSEQDIPCAEIAPRSPCVHARWIFYPFSSVVCAWRSWRPKTCCCPQRRGTVWGDASVCNGHLQRQMVVLLRFAKWDTFYLSEEGGNFLTLFFATLFLQIWVNAGVP